MPTVIGISGSLRRRSYNSALLRAAAAAAPPEVTLEVASIAGIPLYDGDLEAEAFPPEVRDLKDRVARADGLLLATPEYNNSLPGVLKNAIDWMSRPASDIARVFRDKPIAIIGATPGRGGTRLAQTAWLPVVRALGMRPWFGGQLAVARVKTVFDDRMELADGDTRDALEELMQGFGAFVAGNGGR